MSDKNKDRDKVLDICRRIERALQRDWGSTGMGLRQRLRTARYAVPPELLKRIHYLRRLQKQAQHKPGFRLKSVADFEAYMHGDARAEHDRIIDDAETLGVFGVPTMVFNGELFWGTDRIDMLVERIKNPDSIAAALGSRHRK